MTGNMALSFYEESFDLYDRETLGSLVQLTLSTVSIPISGKPKTGKPGLQNLNFDPYDREKSHGGNQTKGES